MYGAGTNGQWVRARNEEGAKAFLRERELEEERRNARYEWARDLTIRAFRAIRGRFTRR